MARGSAGSRVVELQARLAKILGENSNVRLTGVYDGQTQNAVQSMQLAQNAWARGEGEQTVRNDGRVDAETWEFLTSRTGKTYVPRVRLGGLGSTPDASLDDTPGLSAFGTKALVAGAVAVAVLLYYWVK
jgi:peptidoglycan hydrolase-like protein with peptidoglycan-binding domain